MDEQNQNSQFYTDVDFMAKLLKETLAEEKNDENVKSVNKVLFYYHQVNRYFMFFIFLAKA